MKNPPHFPIAILVHSGGLILDAGDDHPEVAARLPVGYLATARGFLNAVADDVNSQKVSKGELGNLTAAQTRALDGLERCMSRARKTARLAFPGQTVKLHQEFQLGIFTPNDLGSILSRADIILNAGLGVDNLPALKLKGWTDADTTAFSTLRDQFDTDEPVKVQAQGGGKDSTIAKNSDATDLYEALQTVQNAADLQFPAEDLANTGVRDEFLLNTFPPSGGSSTPPAPTPPPTP